MVKKKNFLDKKITICENIGNILLVLGIGILGIWITYSVTTKNYTFEDEHGNRGKSNICYKTKEGLYCRADIKVEWYGEI